MFTVYQRAGRENRRDKNRLFKGTKLLKNQPYQVGIYKPSNACLWRFFGYCEALRKPRFSSLCGGDVSMWGTLPKFDRGIWQGFRFWAYRFSRRPTTYPHDVFERLSSDLSSPIFRKSVN